ncbi:TlpA disulfide reductase family protein [Nitritalea halalkaliphila]|nr:TlpA disulfide reductase family protein [Nitritalea halalkaliphila]
MTRFLAVFAGLGLVLSSCGEQKEKAFDGEVVLKGVVKNADESFVLLLNQFEDERVRFVDTIRVEADGKFTYTLALAHAGFYQLTDEGEIERTLALYNEDVELLIDREQDPVVTVKGSKYTDQLLQIEQLVDAFQEEINGLNTRYYDAMSARDQDIIREIQAQAIEMEAAHADQVKELISSFNGSFVSLAALGMLNMRNEFTFMDELVAQLEENYAGHPMINRLKNQLDDMRVLAVGQPAPEISLPNPDGDIVNLSDLRGKYVLIDFWAGWCRPCREENPNIVRLYQQYNEKGFEVFGVSLDRTREQWIKAIEDDGLTWTQVSDLAYFNSEAASTYQITAIPATYLVDPDGKIIAKDLRGISLEKKLAQLFE